MCDLIRFRGWNGTREQGGTREGENNYLSFENMKFNDGTKYIDHLSFCVFK